METGVVCLWRLEVLACLFWFRGGFVCVTTTKVSPSGLAHDWTPVALRAI